jgi:hypothetical protein
MRHKFFITTLAVVTLIITSCSKNNSSDTSSNNVSATISIGNTTPFQFSATGASVKFYQSVPGSGGADYGLEAIDTHNNKLHIGFDNITQTGTYSFTSNDGLIGTGSAFTFIKDMGSPLQLVYWTLDPSYTDRGSVTITVFNSHHVEGVFNASCKPELTGEVAQVSNGSFKVNF